MRQIYNVFLLAEGSGGGVIDRNGSIFQSPWEDAALGSAIN